MRNLILLASLLIAAPAAADSFGAVRRVVFTCQTSEPAPINTDRVWTKCSNKHLMHTDSSNVTTDLHAAGGGGGSVDGLKAAYEAASSTAQNVIAVTASLGVPTFRDDGVTETGIFRAQDSSGGWDMVRADNLDQAVTLATGSWGYAATPYLDATGGNITSRSTTNATGGAPVQASTTFTQLGAGHDGTASRRVGTYVYGTASATGSSAYAAEAHYGVFRAGVGHDGVVVLRNNAATTTTVSGLAATSATLTTPVINGATSVSGNFDLSGSSGTTKTTTGAVTVGPGAVGITGAATFSGGIAASGANANDFSGGSGTFKTSTGAVTIGPGAVGVSGAATFSGGIAASGANANDFSGGSGTFKTSTGAGTLSGDTTVASGKTLTVQGGLLAATGSTPTCTTQAAAGTTATCTNVAGNPTAFRFTVTQSGTGQTGGVWVHITGFTYPQTPICTVNNGNKVSTIPSKLYTPYYDVANSNTTTLKFGLDYGTDALPGAWTMVVTCIPPV